MGLAVAREILRRRPDRKLVLLEKEPRLAQHQSGHNSGVIHSGIYYKPGSLKARLCAEGRERLLRFCDEKAIPYRLDGKLIVAVREGDLAPLDEIFARGQANGTPDIAKIGPEGIREREPHARGLAAIWVPTAGAVDYGKVALALAGDVEDLGGEIRLGVEATRIESGAGKPAITTSEATVRASRVIVCAGLQSDRMAAGKAARGSPHRPLPRGLLRADSGGAAPGPLDDQSGPRSPLPLPRRALHPPHRRRGARRAQRRPRPGARGLRSLPRAAGGRLEHVHVARFLAVRHAALADGRGRDVARLREDGISAPAAGLRPGDPLLRICYPVPAGFGRRRSAETAAWSTTS